jgi:hypothetical protein
MQALRIWPSVSRMAGKSQSWIWYDILANVEPIVHMTTSVGMPLEFNHERD